MNTILCPLNIVDDPACVLTMHDYLSSPNVDFTAALSPYYLQDQSRGRVMRVTTANQSALTFAIRATYGGASFSAQMAALMRANLSAAATWRFVGYSNANWTGIVADTGTLTALDTTNVGGIEVYPAFQPTSVYDPRLGRRFAFATFAQATVKSWEIYITDPTNANAYVDVSRAFIGNYFQLSIPAAHPITLGSGDNSAQWPTDGGSLRIDASVPFRKMNFDIKAAPDLDRQVWINLAEYCGKSRDFFICVYPSQSAATLRDYTMQAVFSGELPQLQTDAVVLNNAAITVREV
jgi:hypothetical protein